MTSNDPKARRSPSRWLALLTVVLTVLGPPLASASEPPRVVASILPIHALAAMVLGDVGEPVLLVPPLASPHAFALRPSDASALADADLVVWIGPTFEVFLDGVLDDVAPEARHLALLDAPGVAHLPIRRGGVWDEDVHDDHGEGLDEEDTDHDDHADGEDQDHESMVDGHIWLDPRNAQAIVRAIAAELVAIDPDRAKTYRANADAALVALESLDAEVAKTLAATVDRPFFVMHDAYQYFEARYGLNAAGSITVHPEQPPSARRLIEIRERIGASDRPCVMAEPQFPDRAVAVIAEDTDALIGRLDPLGSGPPGAGAYDAMMRALATSLSVCLADEATN
jgi:zinc transport system substrate-binding protein